VCRELLYKAQLVFICSRLAACMQRLLILRFVSFVIGSPFAIMVIFGITKGRRSGAAYLGNEPLHPVGIKLGADPCIELNALLFRVDTLTKIPEFAYSIASSAALLAWRHDCQTHHSSSS
jgi:hypothetical protein